MFLRTRFQNKKLSTLSKIYLNFDGYFSDPIIQKVPALSGVFCVYRSKFNLERSAVSAHQLLYIGEASNVKKSIEFHPLRPHWLSSLKAGEELCYTFAPILLERLQAAHALIHQHMPLTNAYEPTNYSNHPITEIALSGRIQLMNYSFIAFRNESLTMSDLKPQGKLRRLNLQNWVEA